MRSPVPATGGRNHVLRVRSACVSTRHPHRQDAAAAIGCDVAQICKSLVFRLVGDDRPLLVIKSGANRVDEEAVGALAGGRLENADAAFVRERTGFAIGG